MDAVAAVEALRRFGAGLSQHARLITLASAQARGLPESLMVESFTGREAVNELFVFDVDALSVSTGLDLTEFIGEEMTITCCSPMAAGARGMACAPMRRGSVRTAAWRATACV